jgi:hypothetical protein
MSRYFFHFSPTRFFLALPVCVSGREEELVNVISLPETLVRSASENVGCQLQSILEQEEAVRERH